MILENNANDIEEQYRCLSVAEKASERAGNHLQELMGSQINVVEELPRDIKLEADLESESIILEVLKRETDFPILTEERGLLLDRKTSTETEYRWIVDPLDGSLNFSRGMPMCCVSIALWQVAKPILGVVYDFNRSEMYKGLVSEGTWLNNKPISPSEVDEVSKAVLATGFPVSSDFSEASIMAFAKDVRAYKKIRLLGSAALSLAYVSCGRVDAYREDNIKIWDVAAGLALVNAAGGRTGCRGYPQDEIVDVWAGIVID